jgi:hypothetical protein
MEDFPSANHLADSLKPEEVFEEVEEVLKRFSGRT